MQNGKSRLEKIHSRVKELEEMVITVGVHKDAGKYENGMDISQVALINHFGSLDGKIPSRPFLTIAKKESESSIRKKMMEAASIASSGGDGAAIFKKAGDSLADSAKSVIDAVSALTENSAATIKKKGKNHPLYDTGKLRNSIKSKVEQ